MTKNFLSIIFLLFVSFQIISAQNRTDFKPSITVIKCVDCPEIISLENPEYPKYVGTGPHEYNGTVTVMISIDEKGNVLSAKGISGNPYFRPMLEREALKAKFRPTMVSGQLIKVDAYILYNVNSVTIRKSENIKTIAVGHLAPDTKPIFLPQPNYPAAAKPLKLSGEVTVEILIDENGNIERATAVSGNPLLRAAAVAAAKQAIFPPQTLSGKPIKILRSIVYKFNFGYEVEKNIDDEIILGKAVKSPKPSLPSFSGKMENNSSVLVETEIDENGNVISAKAISGHPLLKATSLAAARNSKFSQTTISGIPVKAKALLTYEYILADELIINVIVNSIEPQNK